MDEEVGIIIKESVLKYIIGELLNAQTPLVPYKQNSLEFSNLAHEIKNNHIQNVLDKLPSDIVNTISWEHHFTK